MQSKVCTDSRKAEFSNNAYWLSFKHSWMSWIFAFFPLFLSFFLLIFSSLFQSTNHQHQLNQTINPWTYILSYIDILYGGLVILSTKKRGASGQFLDPYTILLYRKLVVLLKADLCLFSMGLKIYSSLISNYRGL